jgi:hypothetical protein
MAALQTLNDAMQETVEHEYRTLDITICSCNCVVYGRDDRQKQKQRQIACAFAARAEVYQAVPDCEMFDPRKRLCRV